MSTIVRDDAPETTPTDRQALAADLLRIAAAHARQSDRALAHIVWASVRHGLDAGAIRAASGMTNDEIAACLDRWAGDQP